MGKYMVRAEHLEERVYLNKTADYEMKLDFNEKEAAGSSQYFLSSLASCKLVSLLELRKKFEMDIQEAFVEVYGETGRIGLVEGSRFPVSAFKTIEYVFYLETEHSDEELHDFLRYVNAACTMGNSISEKIEQNYRFVRI